MTDHDNPETEDTDTTALDALDRRAATAVEALDRAVDSSAIPDFDAPPGADRPARRALPPIAIAAGLLVVALVAAVLVLGGGDEQSTVAGDPGSTHLVFPDPESLGYGVEAAFDETTTSTTADPRMTVHGPDSTDDPWTAAVVTWALPAEQTTLDGVPVDVGGPEAAYEGEDVGGTLGWRDGDQVRYLTSSTVTRKGLVALAAGTAADGRAEGEPLPGHEILFTGSAGDVFPSALVMLGRGGAPGTALSGVVYSDADEPRSVLVATGRGSDAAFRASTALAIGTRAVDVRGNDAVLAEFAGDDETGMLHLSWREPDGTLVRVDSIGLDTETLLDQMGQLEVIDADAFAQLVADHGLDAPDPSLPGDSGTSDETGEAIVDQVLAEVSTEEDGATYRATLTRADDGDLTIEASDEGLSSGSATATTLASTDTSAVLRHELEDGRTVVAGVIGPTRDGFAELSFPGQDVFDDSIIGPSTATIEGSDHVLFLAVVPAEIDPDGGSVITTAPDGSIVTLPL